MNIVLFISGSHLRKCVYSPETYLGSKRNCELEICIQTYLLVLMESPKQLVEQVVACALVTQRARVRSLVGTSFLGEIFSGFFLNRKTNVGKL